LAGFAAIAGVVRSEPIDLDAAFDIAVYGAMTALFSLAGIQFGSGPHEEIALRILAGMLAVVSALAAARNIAVIAKARTDPGEPIAGISARMGTVAGIFIFTMPLLALGAAVIPASSWSQSLYEASLLSGITVALFLLLFIVSKHFPIR